MNEYDNTVAENHASKVLHFDELNCGASIDSFAVKE